MTAITLPLLFVYLLSTHCHSAVNWNSGRDTDQWQTRELPQLNAILSLLSDAAIMFILLWMFI